MSNRLLRGADEHNAPAKTSRQESCGGCLSAPGPEAAEHIIETLFDHDFEVTGHDGIPHGQFAVRCSGELDTYAGISHTQAIN